MGVHGWDRASGDGGDLRERPESSARAARGGRKYAGQASEGARTTPKTATLKTAATRTARPEESRHEEREPT